MIINGKIRRLKIQMNWGINMEGISFPTFQLSGKKAVVTGGSKGIGLAIAAGLAHFGAEVMITGRNEEALKEAAEGLSKQGYNVKWKTVDVTKKGRYSIFVQSY